MRLPIKFKGMGLRSLYDRRHAEYIGGMVQGIPPLLDRISPSGITIKGRMHTESMVRWLGVGSFSADPEKAPWNGILSQGNSSVIGTGLREGWENLQDEVIDINRRQEMEAPVELLNMPVERAGFDINSKISYPSITRQLTIEMEALRSELLTKEINSDVSSFTNTKRERTAYRQCDE